MGVIQKGLIQRISSSGGGGTIASTTNILSGDGAGNAVSSGIAAGNVVTSASNITGTALVKGSGGAKGVATTAILVDASNNITGIGTLASGNHVITGTETITSASATALLIGANGATNPAFNVDASAASSATGWQVKSTAAAAATGAIMQVISSGTNEAGTVQSKGTGSMILNSPGGGSVILQSAGSAILTASTGSFLMQPTFRGSNPATSFSLVGISTTGLLAGNEYHGYILNLGQTNQHATGAITLQRDARIVPMTHTFVAASTMTTAAALAIDSAPVAGTNATITTSAAFYSAGGAVGSGVTNSYSLLLTANTGATNNYISSYNGTAGEVFRLRTDGQIKILATNTAAGTTGNQTINKPSGKVNIAAAGTTITVTNALCTTASIVIATVLTNDTTALIKNVVPGAGSFVITMNAAVTAETSIGFFIIN